LGGGAEPPRKRGCTKPPRIRLARLVGGEGPAQLEPGGSTLPPKNLKPRDANHVLRPRRSSPSVVFCQASLDPHDTHGVPYVGKHASPLPSTDLGRCYS